MSVHDNLILPQPFIESGSGGVPPAPKSLKDIGPALRNLSQYLLSPVFVQTFLLTFVAEWGDRWVELSFAAVSLMLELTGVFIETYCRNRSQISTVVLAAARNPFWVTIGAILGHALCTGGAVLGGKMIASRISVKNGRFSNVFRSITGCSPILAVTFAGAVLFIIFGMWTIGERLQLFGPLDEGEA